MGVATIWSGSDGSDDGGSGAGGGSGEEGQGRRRGRVYHSQRMLGLL
jgi:hypothetical protein